MHVNRYELGINAFLENIAEEDVESKYTMLYMNYDEKFQRIFAYFHENFNILFSFMNSKNKYNKHFNADESRELITLIEQFEELVKLLEGSEMQIYINEKYQKTIDVCETFLQPSGGSTIPDDFEPIEIIKYDPIFSFNDKVITRPETCNFQLKMIGEGAFCNVYKYKDQYYDSFFALKRAKKNCDPREIDRMKREFEIMKSLTYPYILKVYSYDESDNSYIMEYCHYTLDEYIYENNNNPKLNFQKRKGIALQFLKGLEYIHDKEYLHRDISYRNILVQVYDNDLVIIKLSDFGLVKDPTSEFTKSNTEIKGTIIDPCLESLKKYKIENEIYAAGHILQYIFTGRKNLGNNDSDIGEVIKRCTDQDVDKRFKDVKSLRDVVSRCRKSK